jgi:hypothetical protein
MSGCRLHAISPPRRNNQPVPVLLTNIRDLLWLPGADAAWTFAEPNHPKPR